MMRKLATPELAYIDPWEATFEKRVAALYRGSPRVIYLYDFPDNSTFRYRVYNMMQALSGLEETYSATYFSAAEYERIGRYIDDCDVLVVCRARYSGSLIQLIERAKRKGRPVFYDVDDLVVDPRRIHLLLNTLDLDTRSFQLWDEWFAYIGRLTASFNACDAAIATNDYLAGKLRELSGRPVAVIPNFMNREQLAISERIFSERLAAGFASDRLVLGYFSGSPTHNKDLGLAASAIGKVMVERPDVRLAIAGYMDVPACLAGFAERIERIPFRDFINLQREIGAVEFNLMPLQDNEFTNCKSELKYFEAAAVGTISIASPTFTYRHAIEDGVNGYLADNGAWVSQIHVALDRLGDYQDMASRARDDALERYGWQRFGPGIAATLFGR